ncbi:LacI family DNA-binding transcriptional regulator [Devosia sp. LjRoot16]|uniref:LacI family DNA-binding transcriptional regulator n=1 Tax=unclassified Devosia TaxID=196773 RepID=UPI0006FAFB2D|nr:LacI family DNA-binding transcriptional regulator [Devosia sp. Root105]KQV08883.1 LacI family transcriptional regulator [Devosia sp. Root105]
MVTIKEIAKAVGVSSATVSRVLNFDQTLSVTPKTRQAIIETAEALKYETPRARNRAYQQGLGKVALVHYLRPDQEFVDPYYVGLRLGIESRCQALKIETIKVYHTDSLPEASLLRGASGIIAIGRHDENEIAWLKRHNRNLVFADFAPPTDEIDSVEADLMLATRKLLQSLREAGYRRIAFAGWVDVYDGVAPTRVERRCRAYIEWAKEAGVFDERICLTDGKTEDSGYKLTRQILSQPDRPDALITANDNMAVGAYRAIHEMGLSIPDDIAVASFNDISVAQFLNPPLTTVHLPAEEIGEGAVELLLERMGGRELPKRVTLATSIRWRGSTRIRAPQTAN